MRSIFLELQDLAVTNKTISTRVSGLLLKASKRASDINKIHFTYNVDLAMSEHFESRHLLLAERKARYAYPNHSSLTFFGQERNLRSAANKLIEKSINNKYKLTPDFFLHQHYNPLFNYRLFKEDSFSVDGAQRTVFFRVIGQGAQAQVICCYKENVWYEESLLQRFKNLAVATIDTALLSNCSKQIRNLEHILILLDAIPSNRLYTIDSIKTYEHALSELSEIGVNQILAFNGQAKNISTAKPAKAVAGL